MTPATTIRTNQRQAEEGGGWATKPPPSLSNLAVNHCCWPVDAPFLSLPLALLSFPSQSSHFLFPSHLLRLRTFPNPLSFSLLPYPSPPPFSHPTIANPFLASFLFPLQPSVVGRVCLFTVASCAILYSSTKLPVIGLSGTILWTPPSLTARRGPSTRR